MGLLFNLARMTTATAGNGATLTLGAAVPGFLTFAQAGVADGQTVSYGIADGNNSEVGQGVYTASGTTLTRSVSGSTNGNARIALSGSAQVYVTALAEDINAKVAKAGDTMTGALHINDATASTTPATGALTVAGGAGVGGALTVAGGAGVGGNLSCDAFNASTMTCSIHGALTQGVLYLGNSGSKNLYFDGTIFSLNGAAFTVPNGTASSSPTTGALTVAGGLGVGGVINAPSITLKQGGNNITVDTLATGQQATINFCSSGVGKWQFGKQTDDSLFIYKPGAAAAAIAIDINSNVSVQMGTASTSPTTGALTVVGGVGVSGDVRASGGVYSGGTLLTCFGMQYLKHGYVDLAQWDAVSPTGKHALARRFVDMLEDFDPRDPAQYVTRMLRDEALPGMPTAAEWKPGQQSLDDMQNRLWLAVEILATAFAGAVLRIEALEKRSK